MTRIEQLDPDPYQIEKRDPDQYQSDKQDPDPYQKGLDPQHWSTLAAIQRKRGLEALRVDCLKVQ